MLMKKIYHSFSGTWFIVPFPFCRSLYWCFGTNIGRYMRWTEYTARSTYWILWTGLKKMISTDIIFQYPKWCEVGLIGSSSHSRMVLSIASLTGRFHMSRCRSSKESMTAVSSAFTTWSTTIHSHDRCRVKLTRSAIYIMFQPFFMWIASIICHYNCSRRTFQLFKFRNYCF